MSYQSQFIRIYKRASQSPWDDHSTVLLLANASVKNKEIILDYTRYIYLHRDIGGRCLGLSVSKSLLEEADISAERYISGPMMHLLLMMFIDEITAFCELFNDEFEALFLTTPRCYFTSAQAHWLSQLDAI